MITYLASVLVCLSLTSSPSTTNTTTVVQTQTTKKFEYKVKTFKIKDLEYVRVPTKWKKETPAN